MEGARLFRFRTTAVAHSSASRSAWRKTSPSAESQPATAAGFPYEGQDRLAAFRQPRQFSAPRRFHRRHAQGFVAAPDVSFQLRCPAHDNRGKRRAGCDQASQSHREACRDPISHRQVRTFEAAARFNGGPAGTAAVPPSGSTQRPKAPRCPAPEYCSGWRSIDRHAHQASERPERRRGYGCRRPPG